MHLVYAVKLIDDRNHTASRPITREEQFDAEELREMEQMVDEGDARLEGVSNVYPFTHRFIPSDCQGWWLVIARDAR